MRPILALVAVAVCAASASVANAVEPSNSSTLEVEVLCAIDTPSTIRITLIITDEFDAAVRGLRLERGTLGVCDPPVALETFQFGVLQTGVHEFQWTDTTATDGVAHRYSVAGLDANGDDLPLWTTSFDLVSPVDYATCGGPVIGVGTITSGIAPALFEPCPSSCWDLLSISLAPEFESFVDSGTVVEITGSIDCALGNVEGCTIIAATVEASQCDPVGTEPVSWGAMKSRF